MLCFYIKVPDLATLPTVTFRYAVLVSRRLEVTTGHAYAF